MNLKNASFSDIFVNAYKFTSSWPHMLGEIQNILINKFWTISQDRTFSHDPISAIFLNNNNKKKNKNSKRTLKSDQKE